MYKPLALPVAEKTYLFKEVYKETIKRNPKKVGLFGYRYALKPVSRVSEYQSRAHHASDSRYSRFRV